MVDLMKWYVNFNIFWKLGGKQMIKLKLLRFLIEAGNLHTFVFGM